MKTIYTFILLFTTFSIKAQQWVLDEIADEQDTFESIPDWLIVLLLFFGFVIYKYIKKKDDETAERSAKERRIEEQRLEEELREYKEQPDDEIDYFEDEVIVSNTTQYGKNETFVNSTNKDKVLLTNIETEKYTLSPDGKQFIKAKDCDCIIIPDGVEVIKFEAFMMRKIKTIKLPCSVKKIEALAFSGCTIEKITIPNSIEKFEELIFSGCHNLKEVVFENGLQRFGESMFYQCLSLETVVLPNTLVSIPNSAFDSCISLTKIILPPNLKRIGDNAFCSCQSLSEINIPSSVTDIGVWAFRDCAVSKVIIPNSIYGITEYAFAENNNLKEVILPNTITCIMSNAFYGCEHLHIKIPPSVTYIASDAFSQCNEYSYENLQIEVPKGKKDKLEKICQNLKGKITEYDMTEEMVVQPDIAIQKKRFIDFQIFKEKENLRNSEPMFSHGLLADFKYTYNCTYDNFE